MARVSPYPMVSVREALDMILRLARPLPSEDVAFQEALGRVLAADVVADEDVPATHRSAVDGYAVRSDDDSTEREVLEEITAGHLGELDVLPGTAVRIMTGGSVPAGADAVVMVEDVEEHGGRVLIARRPRPGENVHPPAMDLARGQTVLSAGTRVGPAEVGLLATVGRVRISVHRRPRVAVLATGDEIVEPYRVPGPGMVRDSNRYAMMAAAEEAGAEVVWHGHGLDREEELDRLIAMGIDAGDVLLTSGGVSMGTRDLIKPILEERTTIHFGRLLFKPGKPLAFATTSDGKLVFGLPGFPVSALVTFEVFVRPALLRLSGRRDVLRPKVEVELAHEIKPDAQRLEYQRATVRWEEGRFVARATGLQVSSRLLSLSGANALLEIEPGSQTLVPGSTTKAFLLTDL